MSFDSWFLGLSALVLVGLAIRTLVKGESTLSRRVRRSDEPGAYWLAASFTIVVAALFAWSWARSLSGDPDRVEPGLFFGPYCVYVILEALRAGEIRWGNNHFPRQGRALVYWTILLLTLIVAAFGIGILVYD
jgi:hypothetical protein